MDYVGKKCIVRGDRSGVFYGTIIEKNGTEVTIGNCRRIWRWDGACSLSELAKSGTAKPRDCKFTVTVDTLTILDCIEIIECTKESIVSIEAVKEWKLS